MNGGKRPEERAAIIAALDAAWSILEDPDAMSLLPAEYLDKSIPRAVWGLGEMARFSRIRRDQSYSRAKSKAKKR